MYNYNLLYSLKCIVKNRHIKNYVVAFLVGMLCIIETAVAQSPLPTTDSISIDSVVMDTLVITDTLHIQKDTAKTNNALYNAIIKKKPKSRFAKQVYSFIFRSPVDTTTKDQINPDVSIASLFEKDRGKTIRNISVISLSPFGYSVYDENKEAKLGFNKFVNSLHKNTRTFIVENNLLFKEGDIVDPKVMEETEVLLRDLRYLNDVRIYVDSIDTEVVDVKVVTKDVWSIGFYITNVSTGDVDFKVYDRNFLGFGNEFSLRGVYNKNYTHDFGFGAKYLYRNIRKTFINAELSFFNNIATSDVQFKANRILNYSLRLFGDLDLDIKKNHKEVYNWDSITATQHYNYALNLGWASKLYSSGRRFTVSLKYSSKNPTFENVKAPERVDYPNIKSQHVLTQFSLFNQKFHREHLMRSYSNTENMAYGYNVSAQLGYSDWPGLTSGMYSSLKASAGQKHKFGSFFTEGIISTHVNGGGLYQGVLHLKLRYTTPLFNYFAKNKARAIFAIGYSRFLNPYNAFDSYFYFSDYSTMGLGYENKMASRGKEAFTLNWEYNFFTRFNILEFRYLTYTFLDMAWMKDKNNRLFHSNNMFIGIGVGMRIRNELLVFKTIDIKLGWYPNFSKTSFGFSSSDPPISPSYLPTVPDVIIK